MDQEVYTLIEVVDRIAGRAGPVGEEHIDEERYRNLQRKCQLITHLLNEVEEIRFMNAERPEHSRKKAADFCEKFLKTINEGY